MIVVAPGYPAALDDVQADSTGAEDGGGRSGLDIGRVDGGADAGGDAAADEGGLRERDVLVDGDGCDLAD